MVVQVYWMVRCEVRWCRCGCVVEMAHGYIGRAGDRQLTNPDPNPALVTTLHYAYNTSTLTPTLPSLPLGIMLGVVMRSKELSSSRVMPLIPESLPVHLPRSVPNPQSYAVLFKFSLVLAPETSVPLLPEISAPKWLAIGEMRSTDRNSINSGSIVALALIAHRN